MPVCFVSGSYKPPMIMDKPCQKLGEERTNLVFRQPYLSWWWWWWWWWFWSMTMTMTIESHDPDRAAEHRGWISQTPVPSKVGKPLGICRRSRSSHGGTRRTGRGVIESLLFFLLLANVWLDQGPTSNCFCFDMFWFNQWKSKEV